MFNWFKAAKPMSCHQKLLLLIEAGNVKRLYEKDNLGEITIWIIDPQGNKLGTLTEYLFRLEVGP